MNYYGEYPYAGSKKGLFRGETVDVKAFPCNDWGLYQMHGNVWEWCADWVGDYPGKPVIDPIGPGSGSSRVLRGGSWVNFGRDSRSAIRYGHSPDYRGRDLGFRFARGQ